MSGELFWKIVFFGCAGSGKTTIVDTLHKITSERFTNKIRPTGNITKIAKSSGATLFFDRGIFQSTTQSNIYYHVFTVAGQENLAPLRKKILEGTDAIVFVFDGQKSIIEENKKSLAELNELLGKDFLSRIPFLFLINKQDLPGSLKQEDVFALFTNGAFAVSSEELQSEKFLGFVETCALYEKEKNIYIGFTDLIENLTGVPSSNPLHLS
jgi:small GTP-binding protein